MSFKKNKYIVIKNAVSKELVNFVYRYFLMKREVARKLFDTTTIPLFSQYFGNFYLLWKNTQI